MDNTAKLEVKLRESMSSGANRRLRKSGYLTGNINSAKIGSIPISLPSKEFHTILAKGGHSTIFNLAVDNGKNYNAMVKDIQIAPLGGKFLDVCFQEMSLTEKTHVEVAIVIEGKESLWAKKLSVAQQLDKIVVIGLPHDIPNAITIDATGMDAGDSIAVKDMELPDGITTDADPEHIVVVVSENIIKEEPVVEEETEEGEAAPTEEAAETEE